MTTHDTAERKLKRVKINLLRDDRFAYWRGIMMVGQTTVDEDFPTAATDGRDEIYGTALLRSQNDKQVAFVVLHENLHKIGRHMDVWRKLFEIDPQVANMACDYWINQLLVDMDPLEQTIAFPTNPDGSRMGLFDARFKGMDIPAIFRLLMQEKQSGTGAFANGTGGGNFDEHDWGKAAGRSKEERDSHERDVDQALRQGAREHGKLHGKGSGNIAREMDELLRPKIDWREVMADFVRSLCTGRDTTSWRRPNKRYLAMGIVMPSLISERVGRVALGADMSGSVQGAQVTAVVSEMAHLADQVKPEKIDLLYWDTQVARHEEYDESNLALLPTSTKPTGGGGTSPSCVKRYLTEKRIEPECVVMLTDGYVDSWPEFDCPTLWIVTTKGITAPNGITIHLDTD